MLRDIPNWQIELFEKGGLEKLFEGREPGLHYLTIEHEEFCAEQIGRGVCNCKPKFKVQKHVG